MHRPIVRPSRAVALALLVAVGPGPTTAKAGDDPAKAPARKAYALVTPKDDGIIGVALNAGGDLVGFEWAEDPDLPGVIGQVPFLFRAKDRTQVKLPLLAGYTSTFPAAVADSGMVVGRVSKPMSQGRRRVMLQNQAFVWTEAMGIRGLGAVDDDWASMATAVSRDGRRIAGFSVGDGHVRPVVWDRDDARDVGTPDGWKPTPLPAEGVYSSNTLALSDDGRKASCVDGVTAYLWTLGDDGKWAREAIGAAGSIIPRGVNDAGMVVGVRNTPDGLTHAAYWTRADGVKLLEEPAGFNRSEALAVDNRGAFVGFVDGPAHSEAIPRGYVSEPQDRKPRIVDEGGPNLAGLTAINGRGQVGGVLEAEEEVEADGDAKAREKAGDDKGRPPG